MITLRPYQQEGIEAVRGAFSRSRRVCFQLPTGGGKTLIFGRICQQLAQRKFAVLILAHRRELVDQASRKLLEYDVRHGLCQSGYSRSRATIQVGSVQTAINRLEDLPQFDLIVLDEAHHAVSPSYQRIVARWPDAKLLGVTATPARLDGKGLGAVFDELVCGPSMLWLIEHGYLASYRYLAPPTHVDLDGVAVRGGDYAAGDLTAAMDKATITGDAIAHYKRYLDGRPSIAFCASVAHAERVAEAFRAAGYNAASVDGQMDRLTRFRRINGLRDGSLNLLTSCDLIGEGLDVPDCYGIIGLRPTRSLTIFLQQCGRGLRPKRDGRPAIFLDHVGNVDRHGLPAQLREWSLAGCRKDEQSLTSTCKSCYATFLKTESPRKTGVCPGSDPECPYLQVRDIGGGARAEPDVVDGELQEIDPSSPAWLEPEWTEGINVATARGFEWKLLMERAEGDRARLEHIRRVRGYDRRWVKHAMGGRRAAG